MIADPRLNPAAVELGSFLPRPPVTVWRALTEPDLLARWLFRPTGFVASAGTRFRFGSVPSLGEITCDVLTARPFAQLTYSWTSGQAEHPGCWIIDWTLWPQGRGTRLLLTHTGFDINDRRQRMVRNAMERGWKRRILPRLGEVIQPPE